jgi:hypothetical protein
VALFGNRPFRLSFDSSLHWLFDWYLVGPGPFRRIHHSILRGIQMTLKRARCQDFGEAFHTVSDCMTGLIILLVCVMGDWTEWTKEETDGVFLMIFSSDFDSVWNLTIFAAS